MNLLKRLATQWLAQGAFFGIGLLGVLGLAIAAPDFSFTNMPQNLAVGQDLTADMWNGLSYRVNQAVKADAGGNFSVSGKGQSASTASTDSGTTLATKNYVDKETTNYRNRFSMVIALRWTTYCPAGYEQITNLSQFSNNGYNYIRINKNGVNVSASASWNYGGPYAYYYFQPASGPSVICRKTFVSKHDTPYVSFITTKSTTNNCPSGYNWIPHSDLKGNNDWSYIRVTEGGAFLGYIESWGASGNSYNNSWGMKQWTSSSVWGVCFKVMGVDEDPATESGVYPVVFGVRNAATCTALGAGWDTLNVTSVFGAGTWGGLTLTKNAFITGSHYAATYGYDGMSWGGDGYVATNYYDTHVKYMCYKFFPKTGAPFTDVRLITSGTCPSGFLSVDGTELKTSGGDTGYLQQTRYGIYAGGLNSWWTDDQIGGWMTNYWSGTQVSKLCLKIDNAQ